MAFFRVQDMFHEDLSYRCGEVTRIKYLEIVFILQENQLTTAKNRTELLRGCGQKKSGAPHMGHGRAFSLRLSAV